MTAAEHLEEAEAWIGEVEDGSEATAFRQFAAMAAIAHTLLAIARPDAP